jgi:branched-chain amino acid transport system permease protein
MVALAWLIERLVLRPLGEPGAIVPLHGTLAWPTSSTASVRRSGAATSTRWHVGMPKEPKILCEGTFEGGILVTWRRDRRDPGGVLVAGARASLQKTSDRPGAARVATTTRPRSRSASR